MSRLPTSNYINIINDEYRNLVNQVDKLACFIMEECDGYPNNNESAIESAIKIIKKQKEQLESIRRGRENKLKRILK